MCNILIVSGSDEGLYAWVVANYALGALGGDPLATTGIIELGGASAQVTIVLSLPFSLNLSPSGYLLLLVAWTMLCAINFPNITFWSRREHWIVTVLWFQITFASNDPLPPEFSRAIRIGNITYTLYSHSFLHYGQVPSIFYCSYLIISACMDLCILELPKIVNLLFASALFSMQLTSSSFSFDFALVFCMFSILKCLYCDCAETLNHAFLFWFS